MKLEDIQNPAFLKQLNQNELKDLAKDIRKFLIDHISKTGGHFSSNLGIVELTIGLHYVFNAPEDLILFDVGHQSYVHKILTGRANQFDSLRQFGGLSGFQKRLESPYDCFEAGHSSTAISAATGMALARDIKHGTYEVIAIVGDGSIASGESLEALNYLGGLDTKVIVILNDNNMSIGHNVGGLHNFLSDVRLSKSYGNARERYRDYMTRTNKRKTVYRVTKKFKDTIKDVMLNDSLFGQLGFDYIGPVDGHDFTDVIRALRVAKRLDHSVVVHMKTTKGKGYPLAEHDQIGLYHGVKPFDPLVGLPRSCQSDTVSWSQVVSSHIKYLMNNHKDICVITPAMKTGSCLNDLFAAYPKRCFDTGITEEHAMTMTAGLSLNKTFPILTIYSSFLQRAYDQLNHDIARMNCPCLIGVDRSDLVGKDGPTHQGVFDIGFMLPIPNLIIMAPSNALEAQMMINTAYYNHDAPYVMRYSNGCVTPSTQHTDDKLNVGQWVYSYQVDHPECSIITYGDAVNQVIERIQKEQLNVNVINARFLKPMDEAMLNRIIDQPIFVYERSQMYGSLGSAIDQYYLTHHQNVTINNIAIKDHYVPQGNVDELLRYEGISVDDLVMKIKEQ